MISIHDYSDQIRRAEALLEKSSIPELNKDLIRRFVLQKTAEKVKAPRLVKYLSILRLISERYLQDRTFADLTKDDLVAIAAAVERSKLSDWSKHDYLIVLKTFYRWLGRPDLVGWLRVRSPANSLHPEDLLTPEEAQRVIDAALNDRDRAFIVCLYEGAFRIGELGSVILKNLAFERHCVRVSVSGKTGRRTVTLIQARPYLIRWVEGHPFRTDPQAPLWINTQRLPRVVALDYKGFSGILNRTAKRAGISKAVNPHLWRHSRATPLSLDLPGPILEQFMGWVPGSRMARVYQHLSDRAADPYLFKLAGLDVEEEKPARLPLTVCPHCQTANTPGAPVCCSCNMPLSLQGVRDREEGTAQLAAAIVDLVAQHPEVAEIFRSFLSAPR